MKPIEVLNRDLILRENLAIERTDMAIDRTLLAFVRTSLYFAIAGMTLNSLLILSYGFYLEIAFWKVVAAIFCFGLSKFFTKNENSGIVQSISGIISLKQKISLKFSFVTFVTQIVNCRPYFCYII